MRIEDFVAEFLEARERISTVYEPREDSFLMLEALEKYNLQGAKVLDIGTGSGILAAYCARKGATVTASDIDTDAIDALRHLAERLRIPLRLFACDLFSEIGERFDIVVFNPPYLPSSRVEDPTVDGGELGTKIISRFLDQLAQHLTEDGFGLFVASSLNRPDSLADRYPEMDFEAVRERRLFFETLYLIRAKAKRIPF